jgi:5-methylcytosine-specific restriction endonuclease McrA
MADLFINEDELVDISTIETYMQRDFTTTVRQCEDSVRKQLHYNETYISPESYRTYVQWYNKEFGETHPVPALPKKREYSTTHRIEVAYRTKYQCNGCNTLLPPTFEVDHIIELRNGGEDVYENLQALCPNCHAVKTRANTLRRNKIFGHEFGRRASAIESKSFENFRCNRSKYFIPRSSSDGMVSNERSSKLLPYN